MFWRLGKFCFRVIISSWEFLGFVCLGSKGGIERMLKRDMGRPRYHLQRVCDPPIELGITVEA